MNAKSTGINNLKKDELKDIGKEIKKLTKQCEDKLEETLADTIKKHPNSFNRVNYGLKHMFFEESFPTINYNNVNLKDINNMDIEAIPTLVHGIYYFTIKFENEESRSEFFEDWQDFRNENGSYPNKNNVNNDNYGIANSMTKEEILYIGKSETNLKARIKNHLELDDKKGLGTSALRLKFFQKKTDNKYLIRFGCLYSNKESEDISSFLYPIEKYLKNHFQPLLGNPR